MKWFKDILEYKIINLENFQLTSYHILIIILVILLTRILLWAIKKLFERERAKKQFDKGQRYALYQMIKYLLIIIAIAISLETLGIKVTILVAGSAALLVGIGFGLQQTFNDLISGVIILVDGSIQVDDIIELEGMVGRVKSIQLRTSDIETREGIIVIIPNSKFTSEKVINWSHNKQVTRFEIRVGVSYGSDVELVRDSLLECAENHSDIVETPPPTVKFFDFGDSSLVFDLRFWSLNMFRIERVKSDLRFAINKKFKEKEIEIPFPQRDIHFKSSDVPIK